MSNSPDSCRADFDMKLANILANFRVISGNTPALYSVYVRRIRPIDIGNTPIYLLRTHHSSRKGYLAHKYLRTAKAA